VSISLEIQRRWIYWNKKSLPPVTNITFQRERERCNIYFYVRTLQNDLVYYLQYITSHTNSSLFVVKAMLGMEIQNEGILHGSFIKTGNSRKEEKKVNVFALK